VGFSDREHLLTVYSIDTFSLQIPMSLQRKMAAVNSTAELISKLVKNKDDPRLASEKHDNTK
jgi:hypothetical protein